ncbi:MAG: hypothetical protein ACJ8C4_08610 [Gemmataceae bacterium]
MENSSDHDNRNLYLEACKDLVANGYALPVGPTAEDIDKMIDKMSVGEWERLSEIFWERYNAISISKKEVWEVAEIPPGNRVPFLMAEIVDVVLTIADKLYGEKSERKDAELRRRGKIIWNMKAASQRRTFDVEAHIETSKLVAELVAAFKQGKVEKLKTEIRKRPEIDMSAQGFDKRLKRWLGRCIVNGDQVDDAILDYFKSWMVNFEAQLKFWKAMAPQAARLKQIRSGSNPD